MCKQTQESIIAKLRWKEMNHVLLWTWRTFICCSCLRDSHSDVVFLQKNGHKEDILCVVHCPPCLLATGSYDGEIIVWNVVSGCIQGRFLSPPPAEYQHVQGDIGASVNPEYTIYLHVSVLHTSCVFFSSGLDTSVPSIIFLKLQQFPSATTLISSGAMGPYYEQHSI